MENQLSRISRACKSINKALEELRTENPKTNLYLDGSGNFNIMSNYHTEPNAKPASELIIDSFPLNADGGDW